ncbi:hypothetical protein [Roseibium aggregatum]|uniref:Uncharacterized protein n=1 Tax=Roseibium aggregatum TaxID=187304 RepID=A0A939EHS4_9HYPH|nr:hypothetical protein [Roseibium aggregatum]MBN9671980.1 hypothetical protein [Roseibium aggregatum]
MIKLDIVDDTQINSGSVYVTGHGIPGNTTAEGGPDSLNVLSWKGRFVQAAVLIADASWENGTATITTTVANEVQVGDTVYVSGVSVTGYNGVYKVTATDPSARTFQFSYPFSLNAGTGGAVYLPELLSTWEIKSAKGADGMVTLGLQWPANIPLNSPIYLSGLSGDGVAWNGVRTVAQNPSSNPALASNEIQFDFASASGTVGDLTGASVQVVSLMPVNLMALPWNPSTNERSISLDAGIEGCSAQLVAMVTPAGELPFPLGITPGTANLSNLSIAPFRVGQQAGNSVADIVEFYYAGEGRGSTFDVSQVDGFALPLTLKASGVSSGPSQVGVNPKLQGFDREAVGRAFTAFIGKEPEDVRTSGAFGRLLYDGAVSANPCSIAAAGGQGGTLSGVSLAAANPGSAIIQATTSGPHGLVPGQSITVAGANAPYDGTFTVLETGLTDTSLTAETFTYAAAGSPSSNATGTVTPTTFGVIATGSANLVVATSSGTAPTAGSVAQLSNVPDGTFSESVDGSYTVVAIPSNAGLSGGVVYLSATSGQSFAVGSVTGGGTLDTPVFAAPPSVPRDQFFVIAAPKDWLANQSLETAKTDPLATWWDATIDAFFAKDNVLRVAVGTDCYKGVYNQEYQAFEFSLTSDEAGTVLFDIAKPVASTGQSQSLANATWVWGQAGIPSDTKGAVWDQIVQAFCRGVAMDGVFKTDQKGVGLSNSAWTATENWYTEHSSPNFPNFTSRYCPFSKFLHYGTLDGDTDRTGAASIYLQNLAYGFSEDETPLGSSGSAIPTAVPSKMDGTVADGATMTLTVCRFPDAVRAQGVAVWLAGGVQGVQVINPGSEYKSAPTVSFSRSQSGMRAEAFATVSGGKVTGVTVTASGSGYDAPPQVTFSSPVS